MSNLLNKTEQGVRRSREAWFGRICRLFDRTTVAEETWDELEELLISADVGVATTHKLIGRVKQRVREEKLNEGSQIRSALKEEMVGLLRVDVESRAVSKQDSCRLILVVGVNGSGKTTSIAKLAHDFKNEGKRVILAAADTFRAAAVDQLKHWGERVGVEVVAHQPGGDPGAVVFDALQAAQARQAQVVIIDTAGRLHTKFNLMEELKKIKRVAIRYNLSQEVLLVIDATTGQNGLAQARHFTEAVGVSEVFLAKLDGTAKGGIVLAICDELGIPIAYIGTGEQLDDIAPFDADAFVEAIFS
ncbi:MAG: signal recognition particle-docking protein FtsY [Dehalococcoidia bacterium]|nr:MAG: signal recognition particle-docking protein FtsY [Dehalococcoidia bacterium]